MNEKMLQARMEMGMCNLLTLRIVNASMGISLQLSVFIPDGSFKHVVSSASLV
jgi:hypothetical protein